MRITVCLLAVAFVSCGPPAKLSEVEQAVFTPSCVFSSCHQGASGAGSLNLQGKTWARLVNVTAADAPTRTLVVPGDLKNSYLWEKLTKEQPQAGVRMPQGATLDTASLEMVQSWIQNGAKDD